jgi:nucleoside-diphosphate-sugar epimerase
MWSAFVTGAAGFIGSHLTDRLLSSGMEVVGFDSLSTGDTANLARAVQNPHFYFIRGDVKTMQLDVSRIKRHGWKPRRNSDEAIQAAANELIHELELGK